jgi:hypothetical protein
MIGRTMMLAVGMFALLVVGGAANADVYTGSLSYGPPSVDPSDGLFVTGASWPGLSITMAWVVSNEEPAPPGYPWKYTYTFSHNGNKASLSHIIIEVSGSFTEDDITGGGGQASMDPVDGLEIHKSGPGNPGMPENVYGIKFNPASDDLSSVSWHFFSNRAPVWGDFLAKDGGSPTNVAFNHHNDGLGTELGFLDPDGVNDVLDDPDPTVGPSDGSVDYHILRPDSVDVPDKPTPDPSGLTLAVLSALTLAARRRRRSR